MVYIPTFEDLKETGEWYLIFSPATGPAYLGHKGGQWAVQQIEDGPDAAIVEISGAVAEDMYDEALPYMQAIASGLGELGEDIGEAIGELGDVTLSVIKGAGIALVDGMSDTYGYVSRQVAPYRVEAVAVVWSMLIYGLTISTIFNRIRSA